ncbi:hypothetical protein DPMN_125199 [Dreissena polymorpha]|uniref:Uncharacterized protein n=1 Tax=Dreissena polymorpha TaxID=45954 RepID=A0A9D4JSW4_DREPO|nr:hypothetical protein DPMN_125199 [Dreissena polymorpha]
MSFLNWIEEVDARVVAHVEWAARSKQCQRVVVMSNDTDSFASCTRLGRSQIDENWGKI